MTYLGHMFKVFDQFVLLVDKDVNKCLGSSTNYLPSAAMQLNDEHSAWMSFIYHFIQFLCKNISYNITVYVPYRLHRQMDLQRFKKIITFMRISNMTHLLFKRHCLGSRFQ